MLKIIIATLIDHEEPSVAWLPSQPTDAGERFAPLDSHSPINGRSICDLHRAKRWFVRQQSAVALTKPEPDLFLECQERLGVEVKDCYVVGDAVWDLMAARRAGMLSVGLLSGGYGEDCNRRPS